MGKINTWENTNVHRDIGNLENLIAAQSDPVFNQDFPHSHWQKQFEEHSIHQMLHKL